MIKYLFKLLAKGFRRFLNSDLFRRVFTSRKFPDSQARSPDVPKLQDYADIDVRRTSGDEFIMTVAKGKGQLEGQREKLDMEVRKHRHEHDYVLDDNVRPSIGEVQKEELMERLDEIHEQIEEEE